MPEPIEPDCRNSAPFWSERRGLCRAAARLALTTLVAVGLTVPIAAYAPYVLLGRLLRGFFGFLICWVMIEVAIRGAGFVNRRSIALAVLATAVMLLSHHFAFAFAGVWTVQGLIAGPIWLAPGTLCTVNLTSAVGVALCVWLRRDVGGDLRTLLDIFSQRRP